MDFFLENVIPLLMLLWGVFSWVDKSRKEKVKKQNREKLLQKKKGAFMETVGSLSEEWRIPQRQKVSKIRKEQEPKKQQYEETKKIKRFNTPQFDLIPDEHISEEGFSANSDYVERQHSLLQQVPQIKTVSPKKSAPKESKVDTERMRVTAIDWKRAVILKEILDKPLSLRK